MNASATLLPSGEADGHVVAGAVVLVDGRLWTEGWVRSVRGEGPLDEREAELVLRRQATSWEAEKQATMRRLSGRAVTVAQPIGLGGGASRLLVLMQGQVEDVAQRVDEDEAGLSVRVRCDWSRRLAQRSLSVNGDGSELTVAALVERLNAAAGVGLRVDLLEREVREAVAVTSRAATVGGVLAAVCRRYGLAVCRRLDWRGHRVVERRELRSVRRCRPVRLGNEAATVGGVNGLTARFEEPRPTRLIAEAAGEVVESTFNLSPGWDVADEQLNDDAYGKSSSDDFDAMANVFRLWLLTGDDVAADLFETGMTHEPVAVDTLRFGSALTQDAAGRSLGVVVERSTDGGQTWTRYGGSVVVLDDRPGVYLDDNALPTDWLAAVRDGDARLRVTATVRNPQRMRAERWRGNAFAGAFIEQRHELGDTFALWRVAVGSKYHAAVRDGARSADERDDRARMADWLTGQARQANGGGGRTELWTTGMQLAVNAGDRLTRVGSQAVGTAGSSGTIEDAGLMVARVEHRWDRQRTRVVLEGQA